MSTKDELVTQLITLRVGLQAVSIELDAVHERFLKEQSEVTDADDMPIASKHALIAVEMREKNYPAISKIYTAIRDNYAGLIHESDYKYIDHLLYVLITNRADTLKEALQLIDEERRNQNIEEALATSAAYMEQNLSATTIGMGDRIVNAVHALGHDIVRAQQGQTEASSDSFVQIVTDSLAEAYQRACDQVPHTMERHVKQFEATQFQLFISVDELNSIIEEQQKCIQVFATVKWEKAVEEAVDANEKYQTVLKEMIADVPKIEHVTKDRVFFSEDVYGEKRRNKAIRILTILTVLLALPVIVLIIDRSQIIWIIPTMIFSSPVLFIGGWFLGKFNVCLFGYMVDRNKASKNYKKEEEKAIVDFYNESETYKEKKKEWEKTLGELNEALDGYRDDMVEIRKRWKEEKLFEEQAIANLIGYQAPEAQEAFRVLIEEHYSPEFFEDIIYLFYVGRAVYLQQAVEVWSSLRAEDEE